MNSTIKPPRPMRLNRSKAELIPEARYQAWHERASATPGLTDLDRGVLSAIAGYYQRLAERGSAGLLSYERLADAAGRGDVQCIKATVRHLVELGLIAVVPGSGPRANEYLPALPRRIVASMSTTAAFTRAWIRSLASSTTTPAERPSRLRYINQNRDTAPM
jgi:hypothetical protein